MVKTAGIFAILLISTLTLWAVGGRAKSSAPAPKASAAQGKVLFDHNCAMCHNTDSTKAKIGPGLQGLFKNKELPASHKPATDANVREQILKGAPQAKPMPMPAFADKLKPGEVDSLIQYLKTL